MRQFDAILILVIMGALCAAIALHQKRTGKARLRSWGAVDRISNPLLFYLSQAWLISMALFCLGAALWILLRPYL